MLSVAKEIVDIGVPPQTEFEDFVIDSVKWKGSENNG